MAVNDIRTDLNDDELKELNDFILEITKRYVEAEHRFIDLVFEMGPQEGMTAEDMKQYIMYLADYRLETLGLDAHYGVLENPLDWMDWMLTGRKHNNFFEGKMAAYDHEGLVGDIDYSKYIRILTELGLEV